MGFAINTLARTNQQRAGRGNRCYSLSSSILLHPPSSTKTITQLCWLCDKHSSQGQSAEGGGASTRGGSLWCAQVTLIQQSQQSQPAPSTILHWKKTGMTTSNKYTSLGQSAETGRGLCREWSIMMCSGHIDPTASAVPACLVHHPPLKTTTGCCIAMQWWHLSNHSSQPGAPSSTEKNRVLHSDAVMTPVQPFQPAWCTILHWKPPDRAVHSDAVMTPVQQSQAVPAHLVYHPPLKNQTGGAQS